jgi:hypothetical protein
VDEVTPEEDGSVAILIRKPGTSVKLTFEELPDETISVGSVEVKACAKPGKKYYLHW